MAIFVGVDLPATSILITDGVVALSIKHEDLLHKKSYDAPLRKSSWATHIAFLFLFIIFDWQLALSKSDVLYSWL